MLTIRHNSIRIYTLLMIAFFSPSVIANKHDVTFEQAYQHYEAKEYETAITLLKALIQAEPDNADYHHTIARCYGRQAEQVNWFKAMNYAEKTREHLELARELDGQNIEILDDLMTYYREAPAFLGGNRKKADEIEALIQTISQFPDKNTNFE